MRESMQSTPNYLAYSKHLIDSTIILKCFQNHHHVLLRKVQIKKKKNRSSFLKKRKEMKFTPEMYLENFRGSFPSCYKTPLK